jgi:hypothetical protein
MRPLVDSLRVAHGPAAVRMRRGVYEHDASTCGRGWGVVGLQARGRPGPCSPSQPLAEGAPGPAPSGIYDAVVSRFGGHGRARRVREGDARAPVLDAWSPSSEDAGSTSSMLLPWASVPLEGLPLPPSSHATGRGACVRCGGSCSFSPRAFQRRARTPRALPEATCPQCLLRYIPTHPLIRNNAPPHAASPTPRTTHANAAIRPTQAAGG